MFTYHRFLVGKDDHFDQDRFPQIDAELDSLAVEMAKLPPGKKVEMLLSYFKDGSVKNEYAVSNPEFAEMLRAKSLPTRSIEALFTSCSHNSYFSGQLEDHIKNRLSSAVMLPFIIFRSR